MKYKGRRNNVGNLMFQDWYNEDEKIYKVVQRLEKDGVLTQGPHGKLTLKLRKTGLNTPWFFINQGLNRHCTLWHDLYFDHFGLVPRFCMESCWKTVVTVPHVVDLFDVRDILLELNFPSKCGIDVRFWTPSRYDAFIYGDTLGQGYEYYRIMKERLEKVFKKRRFKIILKRGCTEMEQKYPGSHQWRLTEQGVMLEHKLDAIFEPAPSPPGLQSQWVANQVFMTWIRYAHGIGDPTWRKALIREGYDAPKHLYPPPNTYHDLSFEEVERILNEPCKPSNWIGGPDGTFDKDGT